MASEGIKEVLVRCSNCGKRFSSARTFADTGEFRLMPAHSETCTHCNQVTQCDFDNMTYVTESGAVAHGRVPATLCN